jgi:hypothetical protein
MVCKPLSIVSASSQQAPAEVEAASVRIWIRPAPPAAAAAAAAAAGPECGRSPSRLSDSIYELGQRLRRLGAEAEDEDLPDSVCLDGPPARPAAAAAGPAPQSREGLVRFLEGLLGRLAARPALSRFRPRPAPPSPSGPRSPRSSSRTS